MVSTRTATEHAEEVVMDDETFEERQARWRTEDAAFDKADRRLGVVGSIVVGVVAGLLLAVALVVIFSE